MTKRIQGAGGGGKGGGGSARVPVEARDSLRSKAFAKVLDLVSEGEIEGLANGLQSIYLDGTPIQNPDGSYNFKGLEVATRTGSQAQSYIPGFSAVENTIQVNTEVTAATSVTRQLTNTNLDAVRVTIAIPQLTYQDPSNGDLNGTTVQYAIDLQSNGAGFVPQILGQIWDQSNLTAIGPAWFRATTNDARGLQIRASFAGITNQTYRMEYRLVGSTTWLTAGVTYTAGGGNKLRVGFASFAASLGAGVSFPVSFTTPALEAGQWEARIVKISDGSPAPTSYEEPTETGTITKPITYSASRLYGSPFETITGKTTSRYQRSHLIRLTGSPPWDIRVRRITADSTGVNLQNKTFWDTYTEMIEAKLRYPNSALVGIRVDASQFQNIPTRGYDMKLLRVQVPTNYDPETRTYTGSWDGTFQVAWTDNPAWCFYDLLTNERYGLGSYLDAAQVDKWALYQIGRYCDELVPDGFGGTEPRFTCNLYLQTRQEAYKVLQDFASIFRGMVYWSTGSVTAVQDAPSDPVALFTAANVIDGKFNYSGSSLRARHTAALVTWNDPADLYRQKVEYVEDADGIARYGVQQTEVVAVGCTSRGQANRVGRWLLFSERAETETVQFVVGLDGAVVRPGHIIKVSDQNRASARLGGRVVSATTSSVVLDRVPQPALVGWTVYLMLPDGTVAERTIGAISGNEISVSPVLPAAPLAQSVWVMSSPAVEAQTFRVMSVAEDEGTGNYAITALKHEPLKYDAIENGLVLQPRDITLLNDVPPAPAGLTVSESLYSYQAEVRAKITLSWEPVEQAAKYYVDWRKDDGNWTRVETVNPGTELLDITPGFYEFKVFSVNPASMVSGSAAEVSLTALGKTAPPGDVTGLVAEVDKDIGITLYWDKVTDLDLDGYEVRQGSTWSTAQQITIVKATSYGLGYIEPGVQTFLVRALDTSGNLSTNTASVTVTLSAPTAVTVTQEVVDNNVLLRWTESTATLSIRHYIVRRGATWAGATEIGTVAGRFTAIFETLAGAFNYWVAAVDLAGNVGTPAFVTAQVSQPPDYDLKYNQDSAFAGTRSNFVFENDVQVTPVDTAETWQAHFTSRGWSTLQDQVNAGFPIYAMPSASSGSYEEEIDYGTVLASTKITATLTFNTVSGTVTATPTISVKKLAGDPWTNYAGLASVFVTDFRYAKIRYDFTSTGGDDLITVTGLNVRFDVKLRNDANTLAVFPAQSATYSRTGTTITVTFTAHGRVTGQRVDLDFTSGAAVDGEYVITSHTANTFTVESAASGTTSGNVTIDPNGTPTLFGVPFVDVQSITLSPAGTNPSIAVYNFVDVPNPAGFKVLLFNTSGTRIAGTVGWSAKGV